MPKALRIFATSASRRKSGYPAAQRRFDYGGANTGLTCKFYAAVRRSKAGAARID